MISPDQSEMIQRELRRAQFVLVRKGRDVIRDAFMRDTHLLAMPSGERTCPIQDVFYRRAGVRIVGPDRDLAVHL